MINFEGFLQTLPIMAMGMGGILLVCLIIVIFMYILAKIK